MKNTTILSLILLLSGCSVSNLNPFSSDHIGYIEGDEIPYYDNDGNYVNSDAPPIQKGARTSKARFKATMKTYTVKGETYSPTYVSVGDTMGGIASWYGPDFHGLQTSNGENYNMYDMTLAHKTWPMDTMVKVTNLDNGKSIVARINDRGPFVAGRVVDCSYAVGKKIGIDKKGICNVRLEVVGFAGKVYKAKAGVAKPKVLLSDFGVQVGAYSNIANAMTAKAKYVKLAGSGKRAIVRKVPRDKLQHVQVFGFKSKDEAQSFIDKEGISGALIVRQ